jgi:hypothetical protein
MRLALRFIGTAADYKSRALFAVAQHAQFDRQRDDPPSA